MTHALPHEVSPFHVACLPFPTVQGTQALLAEMLKAEVASRGSAALLCYATAEGNAPAGVTMHRVAGAESGLRSGPSAAKLTADLRCVRALTRALEHKIAAGERPVVVAHNVEAAWVTALSVRRCARKLGTRPPWVYVAHTEMRRELPTYFLPGVPIGQSPICARGDHQVGNSEIGSDQHKPEQHKPEQHKPEQHKRNQRKRDQHEDSTSPPRPLSFARRAASTLLRGTGSVLDAVSLSADVSVAISPLLAQSLHCQHLTPPWSADVPSLSAQDAAIDKMRARRKLGLAEDARVALYAGNLDGYQGWESLVAASRFGWTLLVATESDVAPLKRRIPNAQVTSLATEAQRRLVHSACDVAAVPRRAPGGLPIKLLDALMRGVPVVASEIALAGYEARGVISAETLQQAFAKASQFDSQRLSALGASGSAWVRETFSAAAYLRDLHLAIGSAATFRHRCALNREI